MRDVVILFLDLIATVLRLARPGGLRSDTQDHEQSKARWQSLTRLARRRKRDAAYTLLSRKICRCASLFVNRLSLLGVSNYGAGCPRLCKPSPFHHRRVSYNVKQRHARSTPSFRACGFQKIQNSK